MRHGIRLLRQRRHLTERIQAFKKKRIIERKKEIKRLAKAFKEVAPVAMGMLAMATFLGVLEEIRKVRE